VTGTPALPTRQLAERERYGVRVQLLWDPLEHAVLKRDVRPIQYELGGSRP